MSEQSKSCTLSKKCTDSSRGVFSQLGHLASEVESGIENLRQQIDSNKIKSASNTSHTQAINFLLHTKKDISQLKCEAEVKAAEFSAGITKMRRVCEFIDDVMGLQVQRLENIETYLEKYGYHRPIVATEEKTSSAAVGKDGVFEEGDRNNCADDKSDTESDNDSDLNNCDENKSPETPTSEKEETKPSFVRTPRLEDLFKDLSEQSIHLLKQGMRQRTQDETSLKPNVATKENTSSFSTTLPFSSSDHTEVRTPQTPSLSTSVFTFKSGEKMSQSTRQKSQQLDISKFDNCFNKSPKMPKLLTQGFQLGSVTKAAPSQQSSITANVDDPRGNEKITDRLRGTPEPPEVLTRLLTRTNYAGLVETSKPSTVVASFKSPEIPTFLTPGFKLNRFSTRDEAVHDSQMKMPEALTFVLSRFEPSTSCSIPAERGGRSARSLFNTPPMPEFQNRTASKNDVPSGSESVHMTTMCFSEPEPPKLLSRDLDLKAHFGYRGASYKK